MSKKYESTIGALGFLMVLGVPFSVCASPTCDVNSAVSKVYRSTVAVTLTTPSGQPASGTGFLWDAAGHVITNHHVIAAGSDPMIRLSSGEIRRGTVVADFPERDIAVIEISGLVPASVQQESKNDGSDSDVITIGNPFGRGLTPSTGSIEAYNQQVSYSANLSFTGLIRTDIQFKPGNSGGPVFNCSGRVVGMAAATMPRGDGGVIGYVIPIGQLEGAMAAVSGGGRVAAAGKSIYPEPTTTVAPVQQASRPRLGLMVIPSSGVLVVDDVLPGTPASTAGAVRGDAIIAANGHPVRELSELIGEVHQVGNDVITLTVLRSGQPLNLSIRLI